MREIYSVLYSLEIAFTQDIFSRIRTNSVQQHSKNDVIYILENQEDVGVLRHKTNVKIDVNYLSTIFQHD